ncbi:MAG: alpha/beta fold hydrolase [Myxococcales bacterium]|nr:alpha/beta fold hydrolase [Myxococcales bacterium]
MFRLLSRIVGARKRVGLTPADVVHEENKWRLLRYRPRPEGRAFATPILMVPSLINRHYVLDLMPGKSFVEWLVARGHDVFVIDWGTAGDEDRYVTFDDICDRAIGRALRVATAKAGAEKAHLLGYCLGGTLAAIHAAVRPDRIATLTLLAAPVAFTHDDGLLSRWTRTGSFDLDALVEATGNVPWPLLQASFHLLRPTMNLAKLVGVIDRYWDDEFLDGFFALETWSNDNVSFPGEAYRTYIRGLYRDDGLVQKTFALSGERVDLGRITCPAHVVTFEHDSIVPRTSAAPASEMLRSEDLVSLHQPGGHVGAVVSRKAASRLWPALASFWEARMAGASSQDVTRESRREMPGRYASAGGVAVNPGVPRRPGA